MNKIKYLTFCGIAMILAGTFMLISEKIGVDISRILVPIMFATGGIFAYLFSEANKHHKIARQYHLLQGAGMIIFSILIGVNAKSLVEFLQYITFFMGTFGIIEILFGFMALNSGYKLNYRILLSRLVSGFLNALGAVIIIMTSVTDEINGLLIAGVLVILGGLGFVIFSSKIEKPGIPS